jgi:hypothetical protein
MLRALRAELGRGSCVKRFAEARTRHPSLSSFQSPAEVVAELERDERAAAPRREALLWALIVEQRTSPHPLWAAMLALMFAPMLCVLRASLWPGRLNGEELSELVLTSFLFVVADPAAVPASEHVSIALRQQTRRMVFTALRRIQTEARGMNIVDPEQLANVAGSAAPGDAFCAPLGTSAEEEADALVELLHDTLADHPRPAHLDLVIETQIRGESLGDYVRRTHPTAREHEYVRLYERLKRRRTRAANRLRKPLEALRQPPRAAPG